MPRARSSEDRRCSGGPGAEAAPSDAARCEQQAPITGECRELGDLGQAEVVGVCCVDTADQGIDETFVHLIAEPRADVAADVVVVGRRTREQRLECGSCFAPPGDQPAACQRQRVAGDAEHESVGDVVETVVPDGRTDPLGMDEVVTEADRPGEVGRVRDSGEERIGTRVDAVEPGE